MIIQTNGPISRAITYFNHAANMDSSADVRSFCFEASKIASALIRRPVVRITRRKEDNDEWDLFVDVLWINFVVLCKIQITGTLKYDNPDRAVGASKMLLFLLAPFLVIT